MRFSYSYKTSDGVRHTAELTAESRDIAFELLRNKGIRAIKVISLEGSKANGEVTYITRKRVVLLSLLGGVVVGVAVALAALLIDFRSPELIALEREAEAIRDRHDKMVATLHLDALRDYQSISRLGNSWILNEKISVGHHDLKVMRREIRTLFRENRNINGANDLYHKIMDAIDLTEFKLSNDEKAFRLLDSNRGKWSIEGERIAWIDPALAAEFEDFSRDLGMTTLGVD